MFDLTYLIDTRVQLVDYSPARMYVHLRNYRSVDGGEFSSSTEQLPVLGIENSGPDGRRVFGNATRELVYHRER